MTSSPHSKWDGDDERFEHIWLAMDDVPLGLYDEVRRPAEDAIGDFIREHNDLVEQLHAALEELERIADDPARAFSIRERGVLGG